MNINIVLVASIFAIYGCQSISNNVQSNDIDNAVNFEPAQLIGQWQCEQRETLSKDKDTDFSMKINLLLDYRSNKTVISTYNTQVIFRDDSPTETVSYKIQKTGTWKIKNSLIVEKTNDVKVIPSKNTPSDLVPYLEEGAKNLLAASKKRQNYLIKTLNNRVLKTNLCPICADRYNIIYEKDNLLPKQDHNNVVCNKI